MEIVTNIYIVRHGQTDWNAEGRIQGSIERSLDDTGKKQAIEIGSYLSHLPIVSIYSSPLKRAHETAAIIASYHTCPIVLDAALREGSYGMAEGMTRQEFHQRFQKEIEMRRQLPLKERFQRKIVPDGESYSEIIVRMLSNLQKICRAHIDSHVIVVSHGFAMKALLCHISELDDHAVNVSNGGLLHLTGDGSSFSVIGHQGVEIF